MRSKTLRCESGAAAAAPGAWFNAALLRKNLTRFWPLWAVYTAAWLIILPLVQFFQLFGDSARYYSAARLYAGAAGEVLNAGAEAGLVMGVLFGCLFAMALFSYLCSPRSVGMMHSFPIYRGGLFLTNYLSGAAVFLGADVLTFLLTAAVQGAAGVLNWGNLGAWFACAAGMMLFFYSFAVFCAMFTGQILAIPAFYAILNALAAGLDFLIQNFAAGFLYGYQNGGTPVWVKWLAPVWMLESRLRVHSDWNDLENYSDHYRLENLSVVAVYAAAGIVLAVLALLVYRSRRSETSGDTVTVSWAKLLFRFGVAFCCALSLGQGLYFLIWEQFGSHRMNSMPAMLACMVLLGAVGYFAAEMLLEKSFRVLKKSWKGAVVLAAGLIALGLCVSLDVTGVETRLPGAEAVEQLSFSIGGESRCSGVIKDAGLIEEFRAAHQALIGEKQLVQSRSLKARSSDEMLYEYAYVSLNYTLKDGAAVNRTYEVYYTPEDLTDPDFSISRLAKMVTQPGVQKANILGDADMEHLTGGEMSYNSGSNHDYAEFDAAAARTIYEALCQDIDAGRFGRNQFDNEAWTRDTYVNGLSLYFTTGNGSMDSVSFDFSKNCTALAAALYQTGVVDAEHPLITYAQENSGTEQTQPAAQATEASPGNASELTAGVIGGADGPTDIYLD